ncbi:dihydrodipicolinate reductase [Kouleothrix sp.]|uniref:NAD(P)H-dependent amine dehydrogenase family protein n=1 Tax=Kouleothrix sp. TaxID=2779161 RepID=UPI00391AC52B
MTIRVVCYGLGPIGLGIARLAAARSGVAIVGAIDVDPHKAGQPLAALLGAGAPAGGDVIVSADAAATLAEAQPDAVLHATSSSLASVRGQLLQIIEAGANVVSTCEELSFPWTAQPQLAAELDAAARRAGVTLLGTGVNPGYAMDALPLMLTAPCAAVHAVRVLRVVDAARRRGPLQRKVGAGLTPAEFDQRVQAGTVRHVGLPESLHMLATVLGWHLERTDDSIAAVLADAPITTEFAQVAAGQVAGVRQVARGFIGEREVLRLELRMYLGAPDPQDTVEIDGDPPVRMTIAGGLHGDVATAAIAVNALASVVRAAPGLASMGEVPLVHFW